MINIDFDQGLKFTADGEKLLKSCTVTHSALVFQLTCKFLFLHGTERDVKVQQQKFNVIPQTL